ncbi:hypothetical protein KKI23_01975 [Patescibacteria group bacterium]|nr:hypothetical protein [Patescibacteria group bacterium]
MSKLKIAGLIIGGLSSLYWLYFNISAALSDEIGYSTIAVHLILAALFLAPLLLAWKWEMIAGWFYVFLALIIGGGYFYVIFFVSEISYAWWIWVVLLLLLGLMPLVGGLLLIESKKQDG